MATTDNESRPTRNSATFMANLMQTGPSIGQGTSNDIDFHSEVQTYDNHFFDNMHLQCSTDVTSIIPSGISVITILDDLRSQLAGHIKTNEEQSFANDSLKAELERYKTQICNNSGSPELNVFFEINKLKDHLQGKDELIRKLKAQIGNIKEVIAESNLSTLEFQALETKNTQLKEELTAVRIKNASLRDENVSIKKRYQYLYRSKAESNSNVSSRATVPEKPKVLAHGLYAMMPKYIPPQKRNNREANTHLPRKETVSLVKQTNVYVNLSIGIKPVTEASKSKSKCEMKTHRNLPARSENMKRVENPLRSLNKRNRVDSSLRVKRTRCNSKSVSVCNICNECLVFGNHNKCGVKNLNYVNAKKSKVNNDATMKQVWKATSKIFASVGSKWRPTGRKFTLGDTCPLTRITKPEVVHLEKSGSVSTSEPANNVIVTPRFSKKPLTSYKHKDSKLKDTSIGSPPVLTDNAVFEVFCLAVLIDTKPDFISTALGTMFFLAPEYSIFTTGLLTNSSKPVKDKSGVEGMKFPM
ncbi:hypothetical protein Tco_1002658 [Tanacetum coccineum]|uniref:Uncharacterized protein n=1 Tax=Tanacetum coccineum TaxID=301880 RepID=A0ABQ5F734_9ASTR